MTITQAREQLAWIRGFCSPTNYRAVLLVFTAIPHEDPDIRHMLEQELARETQ